QREQAGGELGAGLDVPRPAEHRPRRALLAEQPVAARADRGVGEELLGLGGGQLAVDERGDPGPEVAHETTSLSTVPGRRWPRRSRSMARPRWIRERTVPILIPRVAAISS